MTNKGLDMSIKEDQERCRSLVCDPNGIIVAEMVYRCMICFYVSDTMSEARQHYVLKHIEEDDITNDNCTDNIDDIDDMCQNNIPKHLSKKSNKFQNGNRNDNGIENFSSNNKYRNGSDTPIDMSPNSDSFERYLPLVTITEGLETNSNNNIQNGGKSGYVNCAVCGITRYYSCVQRRYGQYTCVPCYRNFKLFFDKPERYSCPNLGKCSLSTRTRCKACWMKACIDVFQVDVEKRQTIEAYTPIKRNVNINNSEDEHLDGLENLESSSPIDDKLDHSDDNNNTISNNNLHSSKEALSMMFAFNNGADLPALFSKSSLNNFGLLASSTNNNFFGNLNDNNNNSIINHNNNASNTNLNNNLLTNALSNESLFVSQKRTHPSNKNVNGNLSTNNSVKNQDAKETNSKPAKQTKPTSGKKIWSCGKCVTCLAEDCNKCVYCLDRPKNGGPFIKKQRCVKRRCLLKLKNKGKTVNNPAYVY